MFITKCIDVCYFYWQVIQSAFSRLIDLENFHKVIDSISMDERDELYHRMGILNVLDPMYPDRLFRLDMRRWEHREWCKVLIQLAVVEPGDNWVDVTYALSRYSRVWYSTVKRTRV